MRPENVRVLVDELAARLAFERVGVRLYDALLARVEAGGTLPRGVARADVMALRREEAEHAALARRTILELGGDPGAVLSTHDVDATALLDVPEEIEDPRTDLAACLDAMQRAELADHDGWTVVLALARLLGREELVRRFERALAKERQHLRTVRGWVRRAREPAHESAADSAPACPGPIARAGATRAGA